MDKNNSNEKALESISIVSPDEVRKQLDEFYFNFNKKLILLFSSELFKKNFSDVLIKDFKSNLINESLTFESKNIYVFEDKKTIANHEFELMYSKNHECNFGLRYILTFELLSKETYNGIGENDNEAFEKKIKKFNKNSSLLETLTKMGYCEYSYKVYSNNVSDNSFTYKSRVLVCFEGKDKKEAFDLIMDLYTKHWKVLNNKELF